MAQAVNHWLLTAEARGAPVSVGVGFFPDKVALGQVALEFFGFSLSISLRRCSPYLYISRGINKRPVAGRSSETLFYFIDKIINNEKLNNFNEN
jgi:hypothetical protein